VLLAVRFVVSISNVSVYSPKIFNASNNFIVRIFNFQYYAYSFLFYFVPLFLFFQL